MTLCTSTFLTGQQGLYCHSEPCSWGRGHTDWLTLVSGHSQVWGVGTSSPNRIAKNGIGEISLKENLSIIRGSGD